MPCCALCPPLEWGLAPAGAIAAHVALLAAWNLIRGRPGRAMIAIRDNPIAAMTMGINTAFYKSLTFGVSAGFTGIAGALSAIVSQFVAPDSFTFILAVTLLVGLVVGGLGSIPGAIFGGIFILFLPNFAEEVHQGLSSAMYGAALVVGHDDEQVRPLRRSRPPAVELRPQRSGGPRVLERPLRKIITPGEEAIELLRECVGIIWVEAFSVAWLKDKANAIIAKVERKAKP